MQHHKRSTNLLSACFVAGLVAAAMAAGILSGQTAASPGSTAPEPLNWTTQQDHQNMKEQLGIKVLRPGPSGRAGATNEANYNPAEANPYPDLPDPLILKSGRKVDRKSTRLNSSHGYISYAVFCLKKKKKNK